MMTSGCKQPLRLPPSLRYRSAFVPFRTAPAPAFLLNAPFQKAGTGGDGRRASLTRSGREAEGAPTESGFPFRTVYRPPSRQASAEEAMANDAPACL